jgi:betaine-aldehyde dehydrogenase
MSDLKLHTKHYINAEWVDGDGVLPVTNPASEEVFAHVAMGSAAEVDRAVSAATEAFRSWGRTTGKERADYMRRMAAYIRDNLDDLVAIQQTNSGKPRHEAVGDLTDSADVMEYYAGIAEQQDDRQYSPTDYEMDSQESVTRYEPMGVVGFILPWNFPMKICAWKLAPALAAGCTVVIKPAEVTPFIDGEWAAAAEAAGLPAGVLNVVHGTGPEVGEAMTSNPDIRKISFTGSTATGIRVMQKVASDVKNLGLELGGKSPIIVFDDADLDLAARLVDEGVFYNCGQCCNATGRLLVQEGIAPQLIERIREIAENKIVGGPDNTDAQMGPQTTEAQYRKVLDYMDVAKEEGLETLTGGGRAEEFEHGFFVEPTIYLDVPSGSRLWREEVFGPVLCVQTFKTTEEAINAGNDTEYGLAATVVTEDDDTARQVLERLEAGHIYHNTSVSIHPATSWGGFKQSGIGRELGPWGLAGFQEVKMITRRRSTT